MPPKNKWESHIERWWKSPLTFVREVFQVEPYPWQREALEAFPHNTYMAYQACKGPGKAQPKSTVIDTPYGKRAIGSLSARDFVFAIDGMPTRVTGVYDRGIRKVYRVSFDDGSSTLVCGEHLWRVRGAAERARVGYDKTDPESGWVVLSTEQIIARGVRNNNGKWKGRQFEIPVHGAAFYPKAALPCDPYVLGAWLGDGCRTTGKIAAKKNDDVENECRRRGAKGTRVQGEAFYVIGLVNVLRKSGLYDKYSHEKYIPPLYLEADETQRLDLLRGLMDTDGFIDVDSSCEFATTSKKLAEDVVWLVRSLGGKAFICDGVKKPFYYNHAKKKIHGRACYRVRVRLPVNPFTMRMKAERWKSPHESPESLRYMKRYIEKIEEVGQHDCCCIAVEHPTKCYLTNDFIVTHNTALLAWLCWNFMQTRPHPNIGATSISGDNLRDNLWKEMAVWLNKSPLLQSQFEWTTTRIFRKGHQGTWFMSARTWPKTGDAKAQADTLAGLHQPFVMFVLDESGGIPESVMVSAEAAMSSCIEGHILQAGNPTMTDGPLYRASRNRKNGPEANGGPWYVIEISGDPDDPNRAPKPDAEWARQQIRNWGRDNPWVLVNVFGKFPPGSISSLISEDEVREAMKRWYRPYEIGLVAKIMGIDVARGGLDASVIARREGLQMHNLLRYRNVPDGIQGGSIANRVWNEFDADACFIDATGGFGSTWQDGLKVLGKQAVPILFNVRSSQPDRYVNKRAEMYFNFVDAIRNGLALPPEDSEGGRELLEALTKTQYFHKKDQLQLEDKEQLKDRLGFSPDEADACALCWAESVSPKRRTQQRQNAASAVSTYSPFAELDRMQGGGYSGQPGNAAFVYVPIANR